MAVSDGWMGDSDIHPIDIVQSLAAAADWDFDRVAEDQIAMTVTGQWRDYAITLAWSAGDQVLRILSTFELSPPAGRLPALHEALNLANDQLWDGSFTHWADQGLMVWRYGLVLAGDQIAQPEQIERMIAAAVEGPERFYPAFQLACWGDQTPAQAMGVAIAQAYGRA
ncbi:YbjN domain-containing protein [Paracoccus sp. p4-l81]|uniref:YbjN domain-containing protein n=1 Tax=unclassified Paracoccus (in: a-proteobacteria) TaxID=2688777 RepID=UPI0035BAA8F2